MARDYIRQAVDRLHGAWGGFYEKVEQIVAEGDMVAVRVSLGGLHQGEFRGVPPTGKRAEYDAYRIMRIEDGKIIEMWSLGDDYGMLLQLGAIPDAEGSR